MALPVEEGRPGEAGAADPKGKRQHRDNLVLIAVAIAGVILTYLVYRSRAASSSTTGTATSALPATTGTVTNAGATSAYGDQYLQALGQQITDTQQTQFAALAQSQSDAMAGFQAYLQNLANEISSLGSGPGATSPPSSQTTSPPPNSPSSQAPTASGAQLLGFTNPATPVAAIGGQLVDTVTGRPAFYGPGGQPGSGSPFAGAISWVEPGGATVYYDPSNFAYADPNRAPVPH